MQNTHSYFNETHNMVRATARRFAQERILPNIDAWEEAGTFPRELYKEAADLGLLGVGHPEAYGGAGETDVFLKIAVSEELMRCTSGGLTASLGSLDIGLPPIWRWGSEEMKQRVVPQVLSGEKRSEERRVGKEGRAGGGQEADTRRATER